jgi:predicted  nucleic acid-binding Zn-ribbon protein
MLAWMNANRTVVLVIAGLLVLAVLGAGDSIRGRMEARSILAEAAKKTEALEAAEKRAVKWRDEAERYEEALYAAQQREEVARKRLDQARAAVRASIPRPSSAAELEARMKTLGYQGKVKR